MNNNSFRSPAMDIIRSFALFFVVSVHFFYNNDYYVTVIAGPRMYIMTLMRSFFMICVPLFIMLSGYLMCNKTVCKAYYKKLIYIVSIYLLASLCCILYKTFFLKEPFSFVYSVKSIFEYKAAPYAWYVEMYIGLFLLCPFLNILYKGLKTKKEKHALLFTLITITALPSVTNIFYPSIGHIINPAYYNENIGILPVYWLFIYPITYYFIGCYLKEYKLNISNTKIAIFSVIVFLVNGSFVFYRSCGFKFIRGIWTDHSSFLVLLQSVLFFAFFDNLKYNNFPKAASAFFKNISQLCFGGYLISWIFDNYFYKILNTHVEDMPLRLNYFIIIVPVVFICSIILSFVINKIYDLILLFNKIFQNKHNVSSSKE